MNGIHDMGGMHGFGPIDRSEHPPERWELRVTALMYASLAANSFSLDAVRFCITQMPPASYLATSYYERRLTSVEANHVRQGTFSEAELHDRQSLFEQYPDTQMPKPSSTLTYLDIGDWIPRTVPADPQPRFSAGESVLVTNLHPKGHTRRPRYIRGKRGVVIRMQGLETFADTNANWQDSQKQFVYNVEFDGRELWGESAEPNQFVSIDLWESYLEPA